MFPRHTDGRVRIKEMMCSATRMVGIDKDGIFHEWEETNRNIVPLGSVHNKIQLETGGFMRIIQCNDSECYAIADGGRHYIWSKGHWPHYKGNMQIKNLLQNRYIQDVAFGEADKVFLLHKDSDLFS